jgi:hypothetical protein
MNLSYYTKFGNPWRDDPSGSSLWNHSSGSVASFPWTGAHFFSSLLGWTLLLVK